MASIYRFSGKHKKQKESHYPSEDHDPSLIMMQNTSSFEPVSSENEGELQEELEKTREVTSTKDLPSVQEEAVSNDQTQTFAVEDVALAEETQTFSAEEVKKETESIQKQNADVLDLLNMDPEENSPVTDELLAALGQKSSVDEKKIEEVFGHRPLPNHDEVDTTSQLLLEMFGNAAVPSQDDSSPRSIQEALAEVQKERKTEEKTEADKDSYVAVHDSADESTKEYQGTFSIEEFLENIQPGEEDASVPELADEVRVSDNDDPYNDTYEEELESKKEKLAVLPEEYTNEDEFDEFAEHLRNRNFKTLSTVAWSFLAFLALLYLESATFSTLFHPVFLRPDGIYNAIYLLVDIQLILIAALVVLPLVGDGAKGLFTGQPNRNSIPFLSLLLCVIHAAVMLATDASGYPLFGCVAAFFAFLSAVAEFLEAKRTHRTFRICGRRGEKLVATPVEGESAEAETFKDQLQGEPAFYSVHKTGFIDGFFRRVKTPSKANKTLGTTILLSLILALGFAVFSHTRENSALLAVNRFMTMAMMTLPLSAVVSVVLPFSHLSKKAEKRNCAIISAADAEEYANADVVSFTDKEIFPPKNVKVTTIRTYGQTRIDKAILYAAMIFQKLGGPLSLVFKKTISGVYAEIPEDFDFLEITADGMCAKIEDKEVFVGNKNYLLSYDFGYTKDAIDESFESHSGKIMYMVIGNELAAKFYIRYSMSKRFKKTILSLFKSGICPAVKTCDPNIDSDLFRALLQNDKIPAGIIKTCEAMKDAPAEERSESGVVCTSTIANLLGAFALSDSLRHLIRANVAIKILSAILGAGIVVFLFLIENLTKVTGLFVLIYQILWMIPVIIPSLSE